MEKNSGNRGGKIVLIFFAVILGAATLGVGIGAGYGFSRFFAPEPVVTAEEVEIPEATITTVRVNPLVVPIDPQEPCFVDIIPEIKAAVVSINVTVSAGRAIGREGSPGSGSGFIFAEDDEYVFVATNNHVVENTNAIYISLDDAERVPARVVGYDRASDIAVIAAERAGIYATGVPFTIARFGDSDALRMGDSVIAIGNAMGEGQTVTRGIISALNLSIEIPDARHRLSLDVLQTDAAVNRGNSGGPLINQHGEVIGIVTAKLIGAYIEGMGYALPINNVYPLLRDIVEIGSVRRTYTGIDPINVSESFRSLFNLPTVGVLVTDVDENSPAYNAGIRRGDLIVRFNAREISGIDDWNAAIEAARPGDTATLEIYRDGARIEVGVSLSSRMS